MSRPSGRASRRRSRAAVGGVARRRTAPLPNPSPRGGRGRPAPRDVPGVARSDSGDGGGRGQHPDRAGTAGAGIDVALRRPAPEAGAPFQQQRRFAVQGQKDPVRQGGKVGIKGHLLPAPGHPGPVQHPVDLGGLPARQPGRRPGRLEAAPVGVAALGAGPVPGGQGADLVPEEQGGVARRRSRRRHRRAVAAAKLGDTADPVLVPPAGGAEPAPGVMQNAPVAHQRPAPGLGGDLAGGGNAVLQRHCHHPARKRSGATGGDA